MASEVAPVDRAEWCGSIQQRERAAVTPLPLPKFHPRSNFVPPARDRAIHSPPAGNDFARGFVCRKLRPFDSCCYWHRAWKRLGVRAQRASMSAPTFARGHGATLTFGAKVCGVCGLFVGFSDDRRLDVIVRFGGGVFVLGIIIVVGVSRRHRVAHEAPANQRGGNVLGYAWCHVGSCLDIATFMDGC